MELIAIGISHNTAPVIVRDALAMGEREIEKFLGLVGKADNSIAEAAVISTCNRTEIYALAAEAADAERFLRDCLIDCTEISSSQLDEHGYLYHGKDAARHLFRVAAGLDSLMVGEHQILGQVREALAIGDRCGTTGVSITRLFTSAISAGNRARNETGIARGAVSVALAAVRMATKVHGDLSRQSVLVIGAGETGSLVGKLLAKEHPADLVVINRTEERARLLAEGLGGRVRSFDQLPDALGEADVVVTATASTEPVIRLADLETAMVSRGRKPLVIVDIASPRDVDPAVAERDDVFLYDLDSLQSIVEQNRAARVKEIPKAEKVLDNELEHFFEWFQALQVKPMILALRSSFEEIAREEAKRHAKDFHHSEHGILERFTGTLINKLLHHPTLRIKQIDRSTGDGMAKLAAVQDLFQLALERNRQDRPPRDGGMSG